MLHLVGISFLNHKMMGQIKEAKKLWQDGIAKNITFIVTKDCQLACKYCYLVGKNSKERMSWDIAKQAIDYILDNEQSFQEKSVVWDFIGGEPFLEIELIEKICNYIKIELLNEIIIGLIHIALVFLLMVLIIMRKKYRALLRKI